MIAEEGPDAFCMGAIANATIIALTKQGGIMTFEDLANYQVAIREPAKITYRGYKILAWTSTPRKCFLIRSQPGAAPRSR
jgi:gamma-glutamyltranspeptidase/glutathione hydrolase